MTTTRTATQYTQHTLLVLLQDKPGALHRAVTLFRRREYNIASLNVERSEVAGISRMTVGLEAPSPHQVMKELERLVDVLSVRDVTRREPQSAAVAEPARAQADGCSGEEQAA